MSGGRMITGPLYWNGNKFPSQDGKPVVIHESDFQDCCCKWCCNEEHPEYPGEMDLLARFPHIPARGGYYPYPNGLICLGPFDVDIYIRHLTDTFVSYDDQFVGGQNNNTCATPPYLWGYYGSSDGTLKTTILANPMPAGKIYIFTIVSTIPTMVGAHNLGPGTFAKIIWSET
jgi:hypothetical protein